MSECYQSLDDKILVNLSQNTGQFADGSRWFWGEGRGYFYVSSNIQGTFRPQPSKFFPKKVSYIFP